jgi:DNA-binding transcriptional LysR family regulator
MNQMLAMRMFRCLVEARSFTMAAERLDTTHSTVSRQLQQLERELGVRLLNRTSRQLSLTDAGDRYYVACVDILQRVDVATDQAREQQQPSGRLRISIPLVLGTLELPFWLPAFQKRFPDIQLDMSCSDPLVDLVADGFDVALRICGSHLADSNMVARSLVVSSMVLVAAPAYLYRQGLPRSAMELQEHRLLAYANESRWQLHVGEGPVHEVDAGQHFRSDNIAALHAAAVAGLGIACFTSITVARDLQAGRLVRVLPEATLGQRTYYALYPHAAHLPAKVRAFVDFMLAHYRTEQHA